MSDGPQPTTIDAKTLRRSDEAVTIRPVAQCDSADLFPLMSDPALSHFLAWAPHANEEETKHVLNALVAAQSQGKGWHWAVIAKERAVGLVSLIDVRRAHRTWRIDRAELAYWIGVPYQGQGYASRSCALVLSIAFHDLALQKVLIANAQSNPGSGRVAEKLGARIIGEERRAFCKEGTWHNLTWREILNPTVPEQPFND